MLYAYDPLGRRVETYSPAVGNALPTTMVYASEDILQRTGGSTFGITRSTYIHGPGVDEPLAKENVGWVPPQPPPPPGTPGVLSYYHADGLGSIVKITDTSGAVLHAYRYDAWGTPELGEPSDYGFTAREWDGQWASGLYYYRSRYYSPETGRFIGEDPIRFKGGNNFYTYVSDSPAGRVDPFGLSDCCPDQKCPSGVWYGGGATGGAGWGTYSGPSGSFSVVRVTCWGKPTLTADVAFGCGGQGIAFVPRPLQAYMGISIDGVVCTAVCKSDLLGTSRGGAGSFFMGVGLNVSVTTGSSTCFALGPGVGVGFKAMGMGCYGGDVM